MKIPSASVIKVELTFDKSEFKRALEWGRKKKYTYEKDEEFADLLLAAAFSGVIVGEASVIDEDFYE